MRNTILALLLLASASLSAQQALISIPTRECVWHAGDDMRWAAADLDESGWQRSATVNLEPWGPRLWIRCHADLSSLRGVVHPAIQVSFHDAFQLFVNGNSLATVGDLSNGNFSMNSIRSFPLPDLRSSPPPRNATIALRVTYRNVAMSNATSLPPLAIQVGEASALSDRRAAIVLAQTSAQLKTTIFDGVVGIFGFILLGLYFNDRSRQDLLLLGLNCLGLAAIFLSQAAVLALVDYPAMAFFVIYSLGTVATGIAQPWFFFSLVRRRVPILFWILIAFAIQDHAVWMPMAILPVAPALRLAAFYNHWAAPVGFPARVAAAFAPFVAFWPYTGLTRRVRPLAALLCMVWGVQSVLYFFVRLTVFHYFGTPDLTPILGGVMRTSEPIVTFFVIAALMWLLFRDQRQVSDERAEMAGQMQAARRVQQYLIPAELPATPGFAIESEYRPAREVGGDFFQILPQSADGSLLIVVGDVAGKGMEAGMLAALIVGAIRTAAEFTTEPDRILSLLNKRLQGRGLVTCLALRIEPDGSATLANAGHLRPYLNGSEIEAEGALPLGLIPQIDFPISRFRLAEGDALILLTDGVVEAQDAEGRLFGFERIDELVGNGISGAALAEAAQSFGQQDDITVLTIRFAPIAHRSELQDEYSPLKQPSF